MKLRAVVMLVGAVLLGGCAAVPKDPVARAEFREADDPLEPMNRQIFAFNEALDKAIIRPVAKTYVAVIPKAGRDGIKNFVSNLNEPLVFANNVLQRRLSRAGTTLAASSSTPPSGSPAFPTSRAGTACRSRPGTSGRPSMSGDSPRAPT